MVLLQQSLDTLPPVPVMVMMVVMAMWMAHAPAHPPAAKAAVGIHPRTIITIERAGEQPANKGQD